MTFTIGWDVISFDQMALIVRTHPEHRALLADALQELTRSLRSAPGETGESREGDDRIGFFGPLVVAFRVFPAEQRVQVANVRLRWLLL